MHLVHVAGCWLVVIYELWCWRLWVVRDKNEISTLAPGKDFASEELSRVIFDGRSKMRLSTKSFYVPDMEGPFQMWTRCPQGAPPTCKLVSKVNCSQTHEKANWRLFSSKNIWNSLLWTQLQCHCLNCEEGGSQLNSTLISVYGFEAIDIIKQPKSG